MTDRSTRDLASALRRHAARSAATTGPLSRASTMQRATVAAVATDQTTITTEDGIPAIRLASYADPTPGDTIQVATTATGAWVALGRVAAPGDADPGWTAYTPVSTGGSVTWSTVDGWWRRVAPGLVYVEVYMIAGGTGTGGNLMLSLPTVPYRNNRRQNIAGYLGGLTTGNGPCSGLVLATGTGARIDQIQNVANAAVTGAMVVNASNFTLNGLYREA